MAMRLGAEDKKKRLWAMVTVSLALTLIAHTVWKLVGGPSGSPPPPPPVITTAHPATTGGHAAQRLESASALDPTLHPERMALAENTVYSGTSRNIFSKDSVPPVPVAAIEKPIAPVRTNAQVEGPKGPPPPPPIDLKFYGFAKENNGRRVAFLMQGEDIFIAGKGDIVDGRYKVIAVEDNAVIIEDLSYNNQQTLPLQTS